MTLTIRGEGVVVKVGWGGWVGGDCKHKTKKPHKSNELKHLENIFRVEKKCTCLYIFFPIMSGCDDNRLFYF